VRVIGVGEHCWRHTRRGGKYVTVIIDVTPIRDGTGPARLLGMAGGRSKQVFKTWPGEALEQCRRRLQQATCAHRGRKGDSLYAARLTPSIAMSY
jgi:hypothetical protein